MINPLFMLSIVIIIFSLFANIAFSGMAFGESIDSLREQLERGIELKDIVCKSGYTLAILRSDKPACLSHSTLLKLEERGHAKSVIQELAQEKIEAKDITAPSTTMGSTIKGDTGKTSTPQITNVPASAGSVVNFYITDNDLNTSPNGVDIIETAGLLEFLVNGIVIDGPSTMIETGPSTGQFYVRLQLPESIDGRPINQDDVIEIKYMDESDAGGVQQNQCKINTFVTNICPYSDIQ